ncbi:hypothetical protein [Shewanella sp. YLB-07]|uniref:hypothetical protein n=1 Tax=Shewanella sp. YLB-07 TaxID=2601268 RepID=UPI00128E651D|nr:hypothetical protein [Shewanella sp. YLB-07]MPY24346.1 hypothetical protein [Shewanella sp. YLB-07]
MSQYGIAVILFLTSSVVQAGSWNEVGKVTRVHSGHGDGVVYFTAEIQKSNATCTVNVGYSLSDNASNTDRIYSLLLSAYVSKQPVSVYLTGDFLAGRPEINAVQFKDRGVEF